MGLSTARELADCGWTPAAGMKPATLVRLWKATKAALNLASRRDPRITNRNAWRDGLSGVAENFSLRERPAFYSRSGRRRCCCRLRGRSCASASISKLQQTASRLRKSLAWPLAICKRITARPDCSCRPPAKVAVARPARARCRFLIAWRLGSRAIGRPRRRSTSRRWSGLAVVAGRRS